MLILVETLLLIPVWKAGPFCLAVLIYLMGTTQFIRSSCSSLRSLHNSILLTVIYFCIDAFQSDWEEPHSWNREMPLGAGIFAPSTERKVQVKPLVLCLTHLLSLGILAHRVSITDMWPVVSWHKRILRAVLALLWHSMLLLEVKKTTWTLFKQRPSGIAAVNWVISFLPLGDMGSFPFIGLWTETFGSSKGLGLEQ